MEGKTTVQKLHKQLLASFSADVYFFSLGLTLFLSRTSVAENCQGFHVLLGLEVV